MRPFKIGELTKLSGCTVKAIRDLKRLAFIRRVKLMGLPLEKIKDLVEDGPRGFPGEGRNGRCRRSSGVRPEQHLAGHLHAQ